MKVSIRLPKFHRTFLYVIWSVLSITGLYFVYTQDWKMYDPTIWTTYTLKLHGISASLMLILIGSLIPIHIQLSLETKRNLKSGIPMLITMFILAFSGIALYYSGESWMATAKMLHIWMGIFVIIFLPIHIIIGRKRKKIIK